jgi:hypothetical protein
VPVLERVPSWMAWYLGFDFVSGTKYLGFDFVSGTKCST